MDEPVHNTTKARSKEQQLLIAELQRLETDFIALCRRIGTSRDLSLAVTHMEDAALRAIRHVIGTE